MSGEEVQVSGEGFKGLGLTGGGACTPLKYSPGNRRSLGPEDEGLRFRV